MTSSATDDPLSSFGEVGARLARTVESGRVSPSYLFEGVDGGDLRDAALAFAAAILSRDVSADGRARVKKLVHQATHPDVHVLEKDKPTVISVAALTAELEQAHQKPLEGAYQVFLIDPAEAMEPEGVARYLKALEEPPPGTVFLLVSTQPDRLPATVLSRVRRVRLPPMDLGRVAEWLAKDDDVPAGSAKDLARWSGGSLARARRMSLADLSDVASVLVASATGERGVASAMDHSLATLERGAGSLAEAAATSGADMKRQHLRVLLADLLYLLGVEARDRAADRSSALLEHLGVAQALRLLERLGRLAAAVSANVSPAVILLEIARALRRR